MNKRLLLSLYDRSGLGAYMPVDLKGHELEVEEHMEKFAELIVRECIGVIGDENYNMLTGKAYCTQLKRHFGVKK